MRFPVRLPILFVLLSLMLLFGAAVVGAAGRVNPALEPLLIYEGTWQVTRNGQGATEKPDRLVNRCAALSIYLACEQSVNSKPTALLVFIPAGQPGHYHTQSILPGGRATGLDDLQVSGNRWTFTSRRRQGGDVTYFRNTNVFTDKNHIHFENAQSTDEKHWTVQESGDEVRLSR